MTRGVSKMYFGRIFQNMTSFFERSISIITFLFQTSVGFSKNGRVDPKKPTRYAPVNDRVSYHENLHRDIVSNRSPTYLLWVGYYLSESMQSPWF